MSAAPLLNVRLLGGVGGLAALTFLIAIAAPATADHPADLIKPGNAPPPALPASPTYPAPAAAGQADLAWHGGPIQKAPKVYLVFWGWHGYDPYGEAQQLYDFFSGIGGSGWAETQTQYYDNARGHITNPASQMAGYWVDDSSTPPNYGGWSGIAGEALRAEAHFGYDRDANYFIATPSGQSTYDFVANGGGACAWHSYVTDSAGRPAAFTNFPYQTDAFYSCGAYAVGGLLDGVSIVGGHEYAETVTDPLLNAWYDSNTFGENGDKCSWIFSGTGAMQDIALPTGSFAVQSLWSNVDHGCAIVGNLADLAVAVDAPTRVTVGKPFTYTVTVGNAGPHAADGFLQVSLPAGFSLAPGPTALAGTCSWVTSTSFACAWTGLAPGGVLTVSVTGTLPTATTVRAIAAVAADGSLDLHSGNDAAVATTQVTLPLADLQATLASPRAVLVGHPIAFTANVTNNGPDDAPAATMALQLPAGTYGTPSVTQGTCTRIGMVATCALGGLASGTTATLTMPMTPTAPGTLLATATATLGSGAVDPATVNNRATATVAAHPPAVDLAVAVADSADPLLAGQPLTYTVNVTNHGPDDAPAVTLTDTLPMGMAYGAAVPSQGSCVRASTMLTCQLGALASGASATVALPMVPTQAGTATDVATATAPGSVDALPANNRASQATLVRAPVANLEVTNLDSVDTVLVGQPLSYVVTVTNHGPNDAPGVTLTDQLPSGASYGAPVPSQGACTRVGASVTCQLGPMANGTTASVLFPLTPGQPGTATNVAGAAPTGGAVDPALANNRASQPTTVRMPATDLAVSNADSADPLLAGQPLAYTVVVTNHGPDDAPGVTLTDTLPGSMDYGAILPSQGTCARVATTVTCKLGALASGDSASVVLPMVPNRAQAALSTASVVPVGAIDPISSNNRATQSTTVRAPATDLAVTVADSVDPLLTGQPLAYTVTVTNHGPDDAPGVTLTDSLPAGMAYGVPVPSQGACSRVGATVTCQLGTLANGTSATLTLPMVPTAAGTASDRASVAVTGGGVDPVAANNAATQSTTVRASSSDLAVAVDVAPGPAGGTSLAYTVTVTNNGPDDAPAAVLTDTLPSGAYGTPSASQGACVRSSTTVTCQLGPLASGASATVTLTVTPSSTSATNTASVVVAGGGVDPSSANNRVSTTTSAVH